MGVDLESIRAQIADIRGVDVGEIAPSDRLVEDLGFDSLTLTELTVSLLEAGAIADDLPADITWEGLTVNDLAAGRLSATTVTASMLKPHRSS